MPKNSPDRTKSNGVELWLKSQIRYYEKYIASEDEKQRRETPIVNENLFFYITLSTIVAISLAMLLVSAFVPTVMFESGFIPINPQILAYLPFIAYVIVSIRSVGVDEVGGADLFGQPVRQFSNGLKWIPFGIFNFQTEKATFVQSEFPGDTDHIQWSDEKTKLEPGKVRPIYLLTGENPDGKLPTDKQMNVGVAALAKFQVVPERLFDLLKNVGPIDVSKETEIRYTMTGGENVSPLMLEVVRHLRDTATAVMTEIAGQISYNELRGHLNLVNRLLFLRLQKTVMSWGIQLAEAGVTKINPGHEFNEKIQDRGQALADRDAMILRAEGEKQKRVLEGEGAATARLKLLEAEAKGQAKIAEVAKTEEGKIAISAEVAGKLAASGNTIVVGTDGVKDLIGIVAAGKKVTK